VREHEAVVDALLAETERFLNLNGPSAVDRRDRGRVEIDRASRLLGVWRALDNLGRDRRLRARSTFEFEPIDIDH